MFRFNHLHAPFNDVRARRAIAMVLNQEDYMRAVVGDDRNLWQTSASFFTPNTPALRSRFASPVSTSCRLGASTSKDPVGVLSICNSSRT